MKHFEDEGCNKRTIQRVFNRYIDTAKVCYSKNSNPQPFVLTGNQLKKIKNPRRCTTQTSVNAEQPVNSIFQKVM